MKFTVDPQIFQVFPDLRLGVIIASGIDNSGPGREVASILRNAEKKARETMSIEALAENPLISNWRAAYKTLRAKDGRPSHEALIRRVLKGGEVPHINKLVDLYNSLSLEYITPFGGEDLEKITGDIFLRTALGTEEFVQLGSDDVTHPDNGEIIYSDSEKVLCRKFNWRESDLTKLTGNTHEAFFVTETLQPFTDNALDAAMDKFSRLLETYCGAQSKVWKLDKGHNEIQW